METNNKPHLPQTFRKEERLCRQLLIDRLFAGGSKAMSAFPMRLIYQPVEASVVKAPITLLISVPKKRFRRAVKRNRIKRQIREAYRKNKHILIDPLNEKGIYILMGIIWLDNKLSTSAEVEKCLVNLFQRLAERL